MKPIQTVYQEEVIPKLQKELKRTNPLSLPRLSKIVINVGLGKVEHRDQTIKSVAEQLAIITGQKAKVTQARKSIAGFKLRQGDAIGVMVTLRGKRMYQFFEKLVRIVLPRVKDFQGISPTAFDQSGTYSLGLTEQIVFPEIEYDKIDKVRGLQINLISTATNTAESRLLLESLGMPFKKGDSDHG